MSRLDPLGLKLPLDALRGLNVNDPLISEMKGVYCGVMGFEFDHLSSSISSEEKSWLYEKVESFKGKSKPFSHPYQENLTSWGPSAVSIGERQNAGILMLQAEMFELFLAKKFPGYKRYSGEGVEALQPVLNTILSTASSFNIEDIVIGIAHRGKLAFMVSQMMYPLHRLFYKIKGNSDAPPDVYASDDVTSHISASIDKSFPNNNKNNNKTSSNLHISVLNNPSHLEIIGSVAMGKVRAKQDVGGSESALCVQIHGDAGMSGQGCVPESLNLSQLPGFSIKGAVHVVVNNQIGFTTEPGEGRTSFHCTDWAKAMDVPVIHVNTNCVDSCIVGAKLAVEYREKFNKDIFLNLHSFRKYGHNEVDEPGFTNPLMYKEIRRRTITPPRIYINQLIEDGILTQKRLGTLEKQFDSILQGAFDKSDELSEEELLGGWDAFKGENWRDMRPAVRGEEDLYTSPDTGVPRELLTQVGYDSVSLPPNFEVHPRLMKSHVEERKNRLKDGVESEGEMRNLDWATAEAMAFGSLLLQGFNVRLCGQDSKRGTFSQRHAHLTSQETGEQFCPFSEDLIGRQGHFEVVNSVLTEMAVLGFEHGYSLDSSKNLVLWEAQFGDFANAGQVVIDNFIATSEAKWFKQTSLTLLLPHGFDGVGPDHSSSRIERFLQLCDMPGLEGGDGEWDVFHNTNMIVVNLTTPAQYFHLLRRQMIRPYRKPLIVVAPKKLLRHKDAVSSLNELGPNTSFSPLLMDWDDTTKSFVPVTSSTKKLIITSGKIYYDLCKKREELGLGSNEVNIVRIEELNPFPTSLLSETIQEFGGEEVLWVQEEPLNAGAWLYVKPYIERALKMRDNQKKEDVKVKFIGRPSLPAAAVGLSKENALQGEEILEKAMNS